MLANRLRKRQKQLRKWAKRQGIEAYRLYEKDIPEFPVIVDWYAGEAVVWVLKRKKDESEDAEKEFIRLVQHEVQEGLELSDQNIFLKSRWRQKGKRQYQREMKHSEIRTIVEQGLKFEVNLSDYLDTGLFLDHRNARAAVRSEVEGKDLLNLFAYTGSFSVYAIDGGARSTTTVDMSHTYCQWAKRNFEINQFSASQNHQVIEMDCLKFLKLDIAKRRLYDLIICDPPTFSNSKRMNQDSFVVDRDYPELITDCISLLKSGGKLLFSNNSRHFKFDESQIPSVDSIEEVSGKTVPDDFRNKKIHRSWWIKK